MKQTNLIILTTILSIIASQPFYGNEYQSLTAIEKVDKMWEKIVDDTTPQSYYSLWQLLDLIFESMKPTVDFISDELPNGRKKLIHTMGVIGKIKYIAEKNQPYSGIFEGAENGLLRLSLALKADTSDTTPQGALGNFVPGLGIKLLRDSTHSASLVSMYSINGQNSWNFFKNPLTNHFPLEDSLTYRALGLKLSTVTTYIRYIGLKDWALANEKGQNATTVNFPFKLEFRPTKAVSELYPDQFELDFVDQITRIQNGTNLYEVWARSEPQNEEFTKIGDIVTNSEFTTTKWGDDRFFIQHNLMDLDLVDHPEWTPYLDKYCFFCFKEILADVVCPFLNDI